MAAYGVHSQGHTQRWMRMLEPQHAVPSYVRRAYRRLRDYSEDARYRMGQFPSGDVRSLVLDHYLKTVVDWVNL